MSTVNCSFFQKNFRNGSTQFTSDLVRFGEKIRHLRQGQSYAVVAEAVGCSEGALRQIEAGRIKAPKIDLCAKLARYFGVPLDWLADDEQDWPPPKPPEEQAADVVREALSRGGLAGELSREERELLAAWRSLPEPLKAKALGYVTGLLAGGAAEAAAAAAELDRAATEARQAAERASPARADRKSESA